jgi:RHS repeat-associated protein
LRLKGLDYYANSQTFNKFKTFSGKQLHDDFGFNLLSYKFRFHDPALGRFISIDPLSEQFTYNSTFAFAENKLGLGMEYEGLELGGFISSSPYTLGLALEGAPPIMVEPAISRPMIEPVSRLLPEASGRSIETVGRTSRFTPEQKANFARGNKVEAEQLEKLGVQKNTKPIEATDPKTGQKGTTTPDAIKDGQTFEIKNVGKQSLTRQLRLQKDFSNSNGKNPVLRINQGAKVSEPLKNGGFEIQYYTPPPVKVDNTSVNSSIKNTTAPTKSSNPCDGNPNCS